MDLQLSLLLQSPCCPWHRGACTLAQSGSSPSCLWPNPKPPEGNDRSSTNALTCRGAAPLVNLHQCPLVYRRRAEGCLQMECATAGWEGQIRMQDLDTKKDVKLERKYVKISYHGCYQKPVVAVPTINTFHPVSSVLSPHGDLLLIHPWKYFSSFFFISLYTLDGLSGFGCNCCQMPSYLRSETYTQMKNNLPRILT